MFFLCIYGYIMKRFFFLFFLFFYLSLQSRPPAAVVDRYAKFGSNGKFEFPDTSILFICYKYRLVIFNQDHKIVYWGKRDVKKLWWKPITFVCNYSFKNADFSIWFATYGTYFVDIIYKSNNVSEKYDNSMDLLNYIHGNQ